MARINVEDKLFSDIRFLNLSERLGSSDKAIGKMIKLWFLAQKHWGENRSFIPFKKFEESDLNDCLWVGFVEKVVGKGYYVKGSEEHFEWYYLQVQKNRKIAKSRTHRCGDQAGDRTGYPPTPTPTPTPTPIKDKNNNKSKGGSNPRVELLVSLSKDGYAETFEKRYGTKPKLETKSATTTFTNLVSILGEDAPHIAKFYPCIGSEFYGKHCYDIKFLISDVDKICSMYEVTKANGGI